MRTQLILVLFSIISVMACNVRDFAWGAPGTSKYDLDWEASRKKLREQQTDYDKHTRWVQAQQEHREELTQLQESNTLRQAKLLDGWEEQSRRIDAWLDKEEAKGAK